MILLKNYWREFIIVILLLLVILTTNKKPRIVETVKVEYKDRIVEKIVTIEKEVVKDKKRRTTIQKPDGTKIVTETDENTRTKENGSQTEKEKEKTIVKEETKTIQNNSYILGFGVKIYPETEYSTSFYMRLGGLPLLIGPTIYVKQTEHLQFAVGFGVQVEI